MRKLTVSIDRFPIAGKFTIARGSRTEAVVVTATISENGAVGHGECVPYPRYGETVEGVAAAIEAIRSQIEDLSSVRIVKVVVFVASTPDFTASIIVRACQ